MVEAELDRMIERRDEKRRQAEGDRRAEERARSRDADCGGCACP
jgi:hypothetical protein